MTRNVVSKKISCRAALAAPPHEWARTCFQTAVKLVTKKAAEQSPDRVSTADYQTRNRATNFPNPTHVYKQI